MCKPGDRVGAIASSDETGTRLFGYGTYEGDFVPDEAVGFLADVLRKSRCPNPRIRLDSGKAVYGCECWWASEEKVRRIAESRPPATDVDIDDFRREHS